MPLKDGEVKARQNEAIKRRYKMSNERDRIREEIARLVFKRCFPEYDLLTLEPYLKIANQILSISGLLIEADNQELPNRKWVKARYQYIIEEAQGHMLKDNFKRVIKEE